MKQEFKLKKEEYYKVRNRIFFSFLALLISFTGVMWGIFYFTNTEIPKPSNWFSIYLIFLFIFPLFLQFLSGILKAKTENKGYKVTFDEKAIKLEQMGSWNDLINQLLFFKTKYLINQRCIRYKEIVAIQKSKNGSYLIKGKQNAYPNTLIISPHIENVEALEIRLTEIKPISKYPTSSEFNHEFKTKKTPSQEFFDRRTIYPSVGIYLLILFISYFWFNPINWPLTMFLSLVAFLAIFLMFWRFRKMGHSIYSVTLDDTRIIVENRNGSFRVAPFNQLTSIKKKFNNLVILTNQVNNSQHQRCDIS